MKQAIFLCLIVAFQANASDIEPLPLDTEQTYWVSGRTVPPSYPPKARKNRVTGHVKIMFTVTTKGRASGMQTVESKPPGVFDKATLKALRKFRYKPTEQNSERKPARSKITMNYQLK